MALAANYTFFGQGNWSLDATGGSRFGGGTISVVVPEGSTVERAFLYASGYNNEIAASAAATLTSGTAVLAASGFTAIGNVVSASALQAFRLDVTDYVADVVGDGDDDPFAIAVSGITGSRIDGYMLAVVYSNDAEDERTIAFLDGSSSPAGDSFTSTFADPIDTTQPGFSALFSLGIGFSFQVGGVQQFSTVDVNGRRLTNAAGGEDDGSSGNGGLITVGGIGDDPTNPDVPTARPTNPRSDDELYDLAQGSVTDPTPYLQNGATSITVNTTNPSNNDNIFFVGFNITEFAPPDTDENDAPTAVNDAGVDFTTAEGVALITGNVLLNDSDADAADTISFVGFDDTGLVGGMLAYNGDGTFTYTPDAGFTGTDSFFYTITDDGDPALTATARVDIVVEAAEPVDFDFTRLADSADFSASTAGISAIALRGNDTVIGSDFDDFISGRRGHDELFGGLGDDTLSANSGNDTLVGGVGADEVRSGAGNDLFVFAIGDLAADDLGDPMDTVINFRGAASADQSEQQDVLRFEGFGAAAAFTFVGADALLQTYAVSDGADTFYLKVESKNGEQLVAGDYVFA